MQNRNNKKRSRPEVNAKEYLQGAALGNIDIIKQYLAEIAGDINAINARNEDGETAAMLAAQFGHTDIVIELLVAGCKVDRLVQIADDAASDGDNETARILNAYQYRTLFIKKLIDTHQLNLSRDQLRFILTITEKRYLMLADKCAFLADYNMLDDTTFQTELEFAIKKFPSLEKSDVNVIKNVHPNKTEYKFTSGDSFFVDRRPKEYTGQYGIVNEGYAKTDDLKPTYGIKWFRRHNKNPDHRDREVRREAKYNHHFTKRNGVAWFEANDVPGLRYLWQKGALLKEFTTSEITRITPLNRVKCLLPLFDEVNLLHSAERQHGDLGLLNVVLNTDNMELRFIDLGKGKKIARLYDDNQNYSRDMNDLWKIVKFMFPEIKKKRKSIFLEAMYHLAQALYHKNSTYACTSAQALEFCRAVVLLPECRINDENWVAATAQINRIADETINSPELKAESLRRGSVRAATFQYKLENK